MSTSTRSRRRHALADRLAELPLFAGQRPEALAELAARARVRRTARGSTVFREGAAGDAVFLVLAGKVKLSRAAADGREGVLRVLGPGELFGELSVFDPGPRTATASAVDDTELAWLSHDQLQAMLGEHPDAAKLLLRVLARRLRHATETMSDLVFTDVPGRVAKALLGLGARFGVPGPGGLVVEHGLTQEEIAQLVGASRETVNKALADFAARGWLSARTRRVVILEPDRLARRAR